MSFQSIEEKIIYEKLTTGRVAEDPKPEINHLSGMMNEQHLQSLMGKVTGYIGILEQTRVNSSFRAIDPGKRKNLAGIVIFIKRVIRRITRWYIEPVCQQQTTFNNAVSPSIGCITEINNEMIQNVLALFRDQEQLHSLQQMMSDQVELLQKEIEVTNSKIAETEMSLKTQITEMDMSHKTQMAEMDMSFKTQIAEMDMSHKTQIAEMDMSHKTQIAEMDMSYKTQIAEMDMSYKTQIAESSRAQEDVQRIGSQQLIDLQARMDKLNKLDLDVFAETYNDPWEKATWGIGTFAQCGEDMVVAFILRESGILFETVSYIDLGANHAKKLSNTYHFYKHGARGVLVEANPALIPELKFYRSGDMILNRCVSTQSGEMVDFYVIGDSCATGDGLSTPDKNNALMFIEQNPSLKISNTVSVETISVNDIVENHLGKAPTILNIDIEGNEMKILRSIDFTKIRPFVIIIEMIPYTLPFVITGRNQEIFDYLASKGYLEYAFTGVNSIFFDKEQLKERGLTQ